jgi:prepilin-type processing-associated H-X9-DG protein
MYPVDGGTPIILADGIDTPTNISYADGSVYVSSGLGTPERNVLTPMGILPIEGAIYRISGF